MTDSDKSKQTKVTLDASERMQKIIDNLRDRDKKQPPFMMLKGKRR